MFADYKITYILLTNDCLICQKKTENVLVLNYVVIYLTKRIYIIAIWKA
jgi:hypothetical protein